MPVKLDPLPAGAEALYFLKSRGSMTLEPAVLKRRDFF
jgi:hypothetical protein